MENLREKSYKEYFSFTILTLVLAIIFLCLARIFSSLILLKISIGLFILWIFLWFLESIFDKKI